MTAEEFVDCARNKGWMAKIWVDGNDVRVIATHDQKPGIDISLNAMTDPKVSRATVFKQAAKLL